MRFFCQNRESLRVGALVSLSRNLGFAGIALATIASCLLCGCHHKPAPPERVQWPVMSTLAAVSVPAAAVGELPACRDQVQVAFSKVEQHFSVFSSSSDLGRVNAAAGSSTFCLLSPDVAAVLRKALRLAEESHGVFDPTIGPLMAVWGFRGEQPLHVPDSNTMAIARACVGWTNVIWNPLETNKIRLATAGMRLDLGGIAKGYAVDLAFAHLRQAGCADFMIDLGGNLRAYGEAFPGRGGWLAGIRDPFDRNMLLGSICLTNGESMATSGNYERFVELDGHHYAHIMDPRTGRPAEGVASVTVLAPSGLQCDGLSATLFILGPQDGRNFLLRSKPKCEALWVPDQQPIRLVTTPGFARRFRPLPAFQRKITVLP